MCLLKKLYKTTPLEHLTTGCLCHDHVQLAVSGARQHADCGALPERENHLAVPPIFDVKMAAPVTSEKSATFEPWECTFIQVCLKTWQAPFLAKSNARECQIAPNHETVDAQYTPSRPVHHHAVAKPVFRRTRTSQPEPQLPLHGADTRYVKVLNNRWLGLLADVSTGHPSTVWVSGDRPSSQDG